MSVFIGPRTEYSGRVLCHRDSTSKAIVSSEHHKLGQIFAFFYLIPFHSLSCVLFPILSRTSSGRLPRSDAAMCSSSALSSLVVGGDGLPHLCDRLFIFAFSLPFSLRRFFFPGPNMTPRTEG